VSASGTIEGGGTRLIPLVEADLEQRFGGKAVQLGVALRAGLPVPPGFALSYEAARRATSEPDSWREVLGGALTTVGPIVAVRSSAVGEDSATASFAGQHATVLGVRTASGLQEALLEVLASASTESAIAYRTKLGLDAAVRMGIVIQKLVLADVAGVLFTRNPVTGKDERVVEATWGLGEAVVQGLVTPDRVCMDRGGRVTESTIGEKDLAIRWAPSGGTEEVAVDPARVDAPCLDEGMLSSLDALATRCEEVFGGSQDIEFAFEGETLFLLQRRAITRG
jgi:pyruvate, water dikinase